MNKRINKGEKHGYWERYYPNGNLNFKGYFNNGKTHGLWESYYQNGDLMYKGSYINDERIGLWEWYPLIHNEYNRIEKEFYL